MNMNMHMNKKSNEEKNAVALEAICNTADLQ